MESATRAKLGVIVAALLALALVVAACDDSSDNNDEKKFTPTQMVSVGGIVSMSPDAEVNEKNVSELFKRLDAISPANTINLTCFDLMIMFAMVCPAAGSASVQYCSENPLSYDVVFDGCKADADNGIVSGSISVDYYDESPDFMSVNYNAMTYLYMGMTLPPASVVGLSYYAFRSGQVIGFMTMMPGVYWVMGKDDAGNPCDLSTTPVTVFVDYTNRVWTSSTTCSGVPAGPVSF